MQNHEMSRIPLVTHHPFTKFATEPVIKPNENFFKLGTGVGGTWRRISIFKILGKFAAPVRSMIAG